MANYLLVHGAWHGGWCWRRVVPLLRAAGHEVFTPTLTGLGERVHLLTRDVGLDTHAQDVIGVLEYEDLRDVVLVGHSYGGMVITAVAERAAERLAHLVYLDAFVPRDGQSQMDLLGPSSSRCFKSRRGCMATVGSYRRFRRSGSASRKRRTWRGFVPGWGRIPSRPSWTRCGSRIPTPRRSRALT